MNFPICKTAEDVIYSAVSKSSGMKNTIPGLVRQRKKMKPYLIGIDSDGTAFDSMTIKHRYAFIPALLEIRVSVHREELLSRFYHAAETKV